MKDRHKAYFFDVAERTSMLSTCASKQVGAVLVHDKRILAIGYNGTAVGKRHCYEIFKDGFDRDKHHEWSKKNELHAEQNLIAFCAKNNVSTKSATLFLTLSPCIDCAKLIVAAGICEVFYIKEYDLDKDGILFLIKNGVSTYPKR